MMKSKSRNLKFYVLKLLLFIFFEIGIFSCGFGQFTQSKSIIIEQESLQNQPEFVIIPLEEGSFILQEKVEAILGKRDLEWRIMKYSNNMEKVWEKSLTIKYEYIQSKGCLTKEAMYQTFTTANSTIIIILRVDLATGEVEWIEGNLIGVEHIAQLKIIGNTAYYSGIYQGKAVVMGLSFFDKSVKPITGLYANHMEVVEIGSDEEEKYLHVYSKNRYKGKCQFQLSIFNEFGNLVANTPLDGDFKKFPFNGQFNKLNDKESLLIGNYARFCDTYSQGIYVKKIENNAVSSSKFYDFSEFQNFFNYLNPRRQKRVKENLNRKKAEGKAIKFNYSMLVHKLQHINNQHIMVAEIYYTEARNTSNIPFYVNGRDYSPYNYKYTHTIICAFDNDGNKIWDNCLPMKALSSIYLHEQVQLRQKGNKLILAYPENGKIKTTLIEADKTLREKEEFLAVEKNNKIENETESGLSAWYDQNFLFWGFKSNPERANGGKVFFVDKLTYELK